MTAPSQMATGRRRTRAACRRWRATRIAIAVLIHWFDNLDAERATRSVIDPLKENFQPTRRGSAVFTRRRGGRAQGTNPAGEPVTTIRSAATRAVHLVFRRLAHADHFSATPTSHSNTDMSSSVRNDPRSADHPSTAVRMPRRQSAYGDCVDTGIISLPKMTNDPEMRGYGARVTVRVVDASPASRRTRSNGP